MFAHVKIGVMNFEESKTFFVNALKPIGVSIIAEGAPTYGVELAGQNGLREEEYLRLKILTCTLPAI